MQVEQCNDSAVEAMPIENPSDDATHVNGDTTAITLMRLQPLNIFETLQFNILPRNAP